MAEAKQALKIVKKKWLLIRASKFFNNELLGECYVPGPEHLLGRTISANLANLTGDIRQQSVTLKFLVTSLENDAGIADVVSCEMAPSAIRRVVRKGSDRLDESFICETENGQKVRIKPMIITKAATNSAVHHLLRKALVSNIAKYVKKHAFESLINEIITSKLQTTVKSELKKVYPLKAVEVRALEIVREGKKGEEKQGSAEREAGEERMEEKAGRAEESPQEEAQGQAEEQAQEQVQLNTE